LSDASQYPVLRKDEVRRGTHFIIKRMHISTFLHPEFEESKANRLFDCHKTGKISGEFMQAANLRLIRIGKLDGREIVTDDLFCENEN
jgi:hypothetical protein